MDKLTFNMGAGVPSNNIPGRLSFSIDGTTGSIYLDRDTTNSRVKFNADAKKLDHTVKINNTDFDGSADITTEKWGAQRDFTIGNSTVSIDGSDTLGYTWTHNAIGVPRVETLSGLGTDYTFRIIPLCLLDNGEVSRDSYFMGHLFLKRANMLSTFLTKINIVCGKNYNQALPRYSMNIEGGNAAEWEPVTFTWNSKKYFGLYYKQTGAGYSGHCTVTGHSSDWSIIKVIDVYNHNTSTILNAEVYNSIATLEGNSYHLPQTAFNDILPRWDKKFNLGAEGGSWRDTYTEQLYITGTSGIGHITFGRLDSYNYLHVPGNSGAIALCANETLAVNNCSLVIDSASSRPGKNDTFALGTETYKWKDAWFSGTVTIAKNTDASGTANNKPALIVGGLSTEAHLEMDNNELMAKKNGTTVVDLYLNSEGGLVHIGSGGLQADGSDIIALSTNADFRAIKATNSKGSVGIYAGNNRGLYDFSKGEWIICRSEDGTKTYVSQWGTKGSSSLPVYFSYGEPIACNSTLDVSITGSAKIVSRTFDRDTSNALNMVTIYDTNGTTLRGLIGFHNTGGDGTGSAYIIPYPATTDSWSGTQGLYIKKGELRIDNSVVLTASNYTNYTVTKTGAGASGTNWGISITGSSASCTGNAASATKLATARTIFGQSFNGTANVVGKATVYGSYNSAANSRYSTGALEIRENGLVGTAQTDIAYAPQIGFHWSGRVAGQLALGSDAKFRFIKQDGNTATLIAALEGNAATASKWAAARTITHAGDLRGSYNLDGSGNVTDTAYLPYVTCARNNSNTTYAYHRIMHCSTTGSWVDNSAILIVHQGNVGGGFGIAKVSFRTNDITQQAGGIDIKWLARHGIDANCIQAGYYWAANTAYADVYYYHTGSYTGAHIRILQNTRMGIGSNWTLVGSVATGAGASGTNTTNTEVYTGVNARTYTTTVTSGSEGIIYSSTQPTAPHVGAIWLKPV